MERATQASTVSESSNYPLLAMAPFLLSLAIAPLVAGRVGAIPALSLALLVWISVLLRLLIPTAPSLRPTLGGWLAVGYVVIVAATFFVSANQGATVTEAILHASYAAGLWLAADMVEHRQTGWLLGALLAGGFVEGGLALREYLQRYKAGDVNWRTTAGFTNPNFLAGYLGPMVLLTLGVAQRRPAEFKPSTWLLATGLLTATVVSAFVTTGSRGGILSVGCGSIVLVFLLFLRRRELDREAWVRFGSLCALAAVVAFALSSPLRGRDTVMEVAGLSKELCPHSGKTSAGESNQFRLLTWRATLNMGKARPVLGWGAGSYEVAFAPHAIAAYTRHAHNTYLQLFADQGLLGLLGWLSLLGLAVGCVVRGVRVPEWYWLPGVGAALVAHAAHSVFDSLSIIPAIPPLIWVLIGIATARRPRAEAEPSPRVDPRRRGAVRRPDARRAWGAVTAGLLLVTTVGHLAGYSLATQASADITSMNAAARLETLQTAEKLLPWDAQLALSKSRAYASMGLDHLEEALREARRALRIAPYRMPTYHRISNYFRAQGRLDSALQQLEQGLKQAPNEPVLLYALAEVQQELGLRREALRTYEKLVKVEASPVGQVRALAEYLEWRFARAHMALASSLERTDPEAAFQHRKAAACLLAQRRLIFNGSPAVYLVYDSLDEDLERALRADEERLWKTLVGDYRRQGETHLADLAREQVEQVDTGRERMEQLFNELRGESF